MKRITVSFVRADYIGYDDTVTARTVIGSDKHMALIQSAMLLLLNRRLWDEMTDAQWDTLHAEISEMIYYAQS